MASPVYQGTQKYRFTDKHAYAPKPKKAKPEAKDGKEGEQDKDKEQKNKDNGEARGRVKRNLISGMSEVIT